MLSASRTRLFNPLLDNPLHRDNGGSGSTLEGSRMLVDDVLPQQSKSILRSPDASPRNHHTTTNDTNNVTMADKDSNTPIPPLKLIPAFLLVPLEQEEQPGIPVIPFMSGLLRPQTLSSPPRSSLESITRLNLTPLMLSKGIIASPAAAIPPVQAVPQAQQLIPPQPQYTQQLAPSISFSNTLPASTFPNSQIAIQVAQPPVLQDIGLNNRSRDLEHIHPEQECTITSGESDSGATSASENHTDTENVGSISVPHSAPKQLHKQGGSGYTPRPFVNPRKKSPNRGLFNPYNPGNQRLKTVLGNPINAKFKVIEWKNSLTRFWYLLERGGYNEKEHHNLMLLLSEMNENRNQVTTEWLKNTRVAEYLEKFEKEGSIFDYDPLVREVAGSILQFWNKRFPLS